MTETEQMSIRFKDVFGSDNGTKILDDLDKRCMYRSCAFSPESARYTDFTLGKQWVINYIHNMIDRKLMDGQTDKVIDEGTNL